MLQGSGYIIMTERQSRIGLIHICAGDRLVNEDIAFSFDGCGSQLRSKLESQGDIPLTTTGCPPPPGFIRVSFNFDMLNDMDIAVNIS